MTMRKTNSMIQAEVNEIGKYLALGLTDRDIMDRLNIKKTQYYVYRSKLYKQHAERFMKGKPEDLAFHKNMLADRLTRLFRNAEIKLSNQNLSQKDSAQILAMAQNIAVNIFKLEAEGIRILQTQKNNIVNQEHGLNSGYQSSSESGGRGTIRFLPEHIEGGRRTSQEAELPSVNVDPTQILDESEVF